MKSKHFETILKKRMRVFEYTYEWNVEVNSLEWDEWSDQDWGPFYERRCRKEIYIGGTGMDSDLKKGGTKYVSFGATSGIHIRRVW